MIKEDLKPQKTQTCLWGRGEEEMAEKGRELEASEDKHFLKKGKEDLMEEDET